MRIDLFSWTRILSHPDVLKKETDAGLRLAHALAHAWWRHKDKRPVGMTEEDVRRYYELVVAEMKRRGMKYTELGAPVYSVRDKPLGEPVTLDELYEYYAEPIVLREGVVKVVGGIPNWGASKGDIDIMIDMPDDTPESILHPIRFRLGRALPPELSWRIQFLDPSNQHLMGPFTNHATLYDLVLIPHHRFVEMAGHIELFKFVPVPKTSVGYHEGEVTEIEQVVARFKPEDYPLACFPPGTLVGFGTPIEDVQVGDMTITQNGGVQKVAATMQRDYDDKLVCVKVIGLPVIKLTPEHPVYIRRYRKCWYSTVRCSPAAHRKDCSWCERRVKHEPILEGWVPAEELKRYDYVKVPVITEEVDVEWDGDAFELFGWYVAEGCIGKETGTGRCTTVTWSNSQAYERIAELVKRCFGKAAITETMTSFCVNLYAAKHARWFAKEFGDRARAKRVPLWMLLAPKQKLRRFLEGYLSGDGCKTEYGWTAGTVSRVLAYQLRLIGLKLGFWVTVNRTRQQYLVNFYPHLPPHAFRENGAIWVKVNKVFSVEYTGPVYNLETEDHTYVTGFLVHNCEKKYDGLVVEWHKKGDKIVAYTDSGKRCEHRFPRLMKSLREHPCPELLLMTETEGWKDGEHMGREEIAGYVNQRGVPDDRYVVANVWDVLWCKLPERHHDLQPEGDVHEWPLEQRIRLRSVVAKLGGWQETDEVPKPGWNNVPSHILEKLDVGKLKELLTKIRNLPGSEGVMIKSVRDIFPLTGHIASWVKYKKSADLHVVVLKRNPTRTEGVYNYTVGLLAEKGMPHTEQMVLGKTKAWVMNVGKTNNIVRRFDRGTILTVIPHTLFQYPDGRVTVYECPVYEARPDQTLPDTVEEAVEIAKKAGILRKKARAAGALRYVLQLHARGKSIHGDLRLEKTPGGPLEGWTLNLDEGKIEEPVRTLKDIRKIEKQWARYLEPLDEPGHQILAESKKDEPHEWLEVDNRMDPPGGVIATKNWPGVMIIVDKGTYERGAQKPYYREWFFHGKKLKGRYVARLLHLRGEPVWMFWKTKTEEPYVLSTRAIREGWFPKEGSALPKELEEQVPEELRYWEVSGKERDERRKKLRRLWLKKFAANRWLLQYQWWRGQVVKRRGPTKDEYIFRAIFGDTGEVKEWHMTKDPRRGAVPGIFKKEKYDEFWDIGEETIAVPPGTKYNPTKATPSYLMTLDSGKLSVLQDEPLVVKYRLGPKEVFVATRTGPEEKVWECEITPQ